MSIKNIILIVVLTTLLSCKKEDKLKVYQEKSNELINQILVNYESECSCIIEPDNTESTIQTISSDNPSRNYQKIIEKELSIDSVFLKNSDELSKLYTLDKSFDKNYKILKKKELFSLLIEFKGIDKLNKMIKICPKGWFNFSPPIFNETFDKAIISYSFHPGGSMNLYEFKNGKWEFVKNIEVWIS
jgi:hypothetical protein